MTAWESDGENIRCTRHGVTFGRLEHCPQCTADPPPPEKAEDDRPIDPPDGCLSTTELERRAVELMDVIMEALRSLRATKTKKLNLYNTIAKLNDNWLKAARLAWEHASIRERRVHVKRLEQRRREMRGRGKKR